MCIICIDLARGALKWQEARRALGEMREQVGPAHAEEVARKLDEAEAEAEAPSSG
jgi:hypothetical protein